MDPRKTVVIADFDSVVRSVTDSIERSSGVRERPSTLEAEAAPAVIIGRTVVTGDDPRRLALSKTQVWRREVSVSESVMTDDARPRARVSVDESVMQHLSAELWAGQAPSSAHMMVTTVRRSIVDVQSTFLQTQRSEPPATLVIDAEEVARANEAVAKAELASRPELVASSLAKLSVETELLEIPRHFRLPQRKATRIACIALCMASLGALALSTGRLGGHEPPVSGEQSKPVAVEATWRSVRTLQPLAAAAPAAPARAPAPAKPVVARSAIKSAAPSVAVANSAASPRAAIDALIAGQEELALARYRALAKSNPSEPAYEAAARILEEANRGGQD